MSTKLLLKQKGRLEPKLAEIGDTWEDCLAVVEGLNVYSCDRPPRKSEWGKDVVVWGETPHGLDGLPAVEKLLTENINLTLIISGGLYSRREVFDEIGAIDLFSELYKSLKQKGFEDNRIKERVIIDSMSMHTGHQRMVVGELLASLRPDNVWVVVQIYHMPRFLMSISVPLCKAGLTGDIILPLGYGVWHQRHKTKGPLTNPERKFTYEELLCLPPTPSSYPALEASEDKYLYNCGELDKIIRYAAKGECLTFKQARKFFDID